MQKFINITPDMKLKDSRAPLVDNDLTVASHYAAGAFPTQNLVVGMECYRTDLKKKYRLTKLNPATWEDVLTPSEITKVKVNNAVQADKASVADSAKTCTGNSATASVAAKLARDGNTGIPMTFKWAGQAGQPSWLWGSNDGTTHQVYNPANFNVNHAKVADSASVAAKLQNARTINGIPFDGTKNIEIDVSGDFDANTSLKFGQGSTQRYKQFGNIELVNEYETSSGDNLQQWDRYLRYYFRTHAGIGAGTYTLQNILQKLINNSHTHTIHREFYNCKCDCNCDWTDSDNDGE